MNQLPWTTVEAGSLFSTPRYVGFTICTDSYVLLRSEKIEGGFLAYQVISRSGVKNVNVIVVGVVGNTVPLFRDPHAVGIQLAIAIGIVKQDNGECPDGDGSNIHFNPVVNSFSFQLL
jgi:hypothetical protein